MKKAIASLILSLVVLVAFGTEAKAQISREGTTSETWAFSGTFKALSMGQERVQMTYEVMGVAMATPVKISFTMHHSAVSERCMP